MNRRCRQGVAGVLLLVTVLAGACEEAKPGVPTAFGRACEPANKGARLAVEGYLLWPKELVPDVSPVLRLREQPTPGAANSAASNTAAPTIGVASSWGALKNDRRARPSEPLQVKLADGSVAGPGDKVRVSGEMYFPPVPQEFPCALRDPRFERA